MIERGPRPTRDFTIVKNAALRDDRLSFRARGLYAFVMSQPDGFRINSDGLTRVAKEGRDAIRSALAELEEAGYLERRKERTEAGRFETISVLHELPTGDGFPGAGPTRGNGAKAQVAPAPGFPTPDFQAPKEEELEEETSTPAEPSREAPDDGLPLEREEGLSYAKTVAKWLRAQGVSIPPERTRAYLTVVRRVDFLLAPDDKRRTGTMLGIIGDYVVDVTDEALPSQARSHLARLIRLHGAVGAMEAMAEAVSWGAGLDDEHVDARALTKYATAVLAKKGAA